MRRRRLTAQGLALLLTGTLAGRAARAQGGLRRVGFLSVAPADAKEIGGFGSGMRELGWIEGRNVSYELRNAEGRPERLPAAAADLLRSGVEVLVAGGPGPLAALRKVTQTVPIVAVAGSDPVAEGWAQSLARPGGNVTGLTVTFPELGAKRLALLKEAMPRLLRAAVLFGPQELTQSELAPQVEPQARELGVQVIWLGAGAASELEHAFERARQEGAEAVLTMDTPSVIAARMRMGELALRERLPWMGEFTLFGTTGMLMAYGPNLSDLLRRAAGYVDRILKDARPGDLPIERPTRLELVLNRSTARALGFTFPPVMLQRADRMID